MRAYVVKRVLALFPTLILGSLIVFFVIRLVPGDIIDLMMAQNNVSDQEVTRASIERALGLDQPIFVQYIKWMQDLVCHGELGRSLWRDTTVTQEILYRLPVTFELGAMAILIGLAVSIPIGIFSAIRQGTVGDFIGRTVAILGLAVPSFWLGTMIVVYPAVWWGWSPDIALVPFRQDPIRNLGTFLIPASVLGFALAGVTMRMTRTMMLEVLHQDYIRTAWAKGLSEKVIVVRHALRNALIPVITIVGLQIPILVGGTVVIEQIFTLPGMGLLMLEAVSQRDYPIVTGVMLFIGLVVLLVNLLVDLSYGLLDPKVRQ